jgi:hypothetical protein
VFGIETLGSNAQAAALVGVVLAEAVFLYVVYGWLEATVGPGVRRVLEGQCALAELLLGGCSVAENGGGDR